MRTLIAVMSCEAYRVNGNNQALRDTWLPSVANEKDLDYKIFMGSGSTLTNSDEVLIDVPDDYYHISYKGREVHRYAIANEYDFLYKCFPDTYVCPSRLVRSGFENYDYFGNFACRPKNGPQYCTGGVGYFLSRKAFSMLRDTPIPQKKVFEPKRPLRFYRNPPPPVPVVTYDDLMWAEDKWSGEALCHNTTLIRKHDTRFEENVYAAGPEKGNKTIAIHLSRAVYGKSAIYDKQWMYDKHSRSLGLSEKVEKIAVITPTLGSRSRLLEECKECVAKQDWNGVISHEISEDTLGEGPSVVRNKIIRDLDSSYEWIAFVDDDDKLFPSHLSVLVANSSNADIVYSDCREQGFVKTWKTREFNYEDVKRDNYIPITVLMRRSMFEKIGGYKTQPPGEDQDLWLRAALAGARFVYVPKETWTYRQHPEHRELPPRRFQSI